MRGAQLLDLPVHVEVGIIPADAGSTSSSLSTIRLCQDHPRGCGEHSLSLICLPVGQGSSPRMRGAQAYGDLRLNRYGIIPADAGSTAGPGEGRLSRWDHPRGCGEHHKATHAVNNDQGSSPRMRGAQLSDR